MFSVFYQHDLTKALLIRCLFMPRVLQVLCNGRPSLLSRLAKKRGIGRKHTTFTSSKNAACTNESVSLSSKLCFGGKHFDWANVNFGRLLNIFRTERSWHAYWFSLVGMICPLMQEHFGLEVVNRFLTAWRHFWTPWSERTHCMENGQSVFFFSRLTRP